VERRELLTNGLKGQIPRNIFDNQGLVFYTNPLVEAQSTVCHLQGFAVDQELFQPVQQIITYIRNLKSPLGLDS
jgi:hypothetical protein